MSLARSLFLAIAVFEVCFGGQQIPIDLLEQNTQAASHQGIDYVIGFIRPDIPPRPDPNPALFISTQDPRGADVLVEVPRFAVPGFPMEFHIGQFETRTVRFPANIRVTTERDRGIHVVSRNGANLDIIGVNDEVRSVDTFLALPCKLEESTNTFHVSEYRYFIFSAVSSNQDTSTFLVVPCTTGGELGNNGIQYTIPGEATEGIPVLLQYNTFLVTSGGDLTGTVITSPFPLAVFSGHQCGRLPAGRDACDHLVEQIPPDIVYGTRFFVLPFAVRESGDVIRVGSTIGNNEISLTCNRRQANGENRLVTRTATINSGEFFEFQTRRRLSESNLSPADYRRDFCCIESSKPAIVMQYMLGFEEDNIGFMGIGQIGDPAMTLVPPVEQYKNNYILNTPDDFIEATVTDEYFSFISWAITTEFFDPIVNSQDFFVNNDTFAPSNRATGGSESYVPFICSNGEICGYGGTGAVGPGNYQVSYRSSHPHPGVYVSFYGMHREISYANPAGLECEPIGSPWISTYDVVVTEGVDLTANVIFNRTGGNLETRTRILAFTQENADGGAVAGTDFTAVGSTRVVWRPQETNPFRGSPLSITILDDDVAEQTEYFEVRFVIDSTQSDSGGYAYPSAIARVTILDNDGGAMCSLVNTEITEAEGVGAVANIVVQTTDQSTRACLLTTTDGSAVAGSDYQALNMVPVMFTGTRTTVTIPILNDDVVEPDEMFSVRLTSNDPDITITGQDTATVTITDSDRVTFGFEQGSYQVAENNGPAQLVIVKQGQTTEDVVLRFATSDGSAVSPSDYTTTTQDVIFSASETRITVPVPIRNDALTEPDEIFTAMISEAVDQPDVFISRSMTQVTITNDDIVNFRFEEPTYTVSEDGVTANLVIIKDGLTTQDVVLQFATTDGSAISVGNADFQATAMNITFLATESRRTVSVPITNDDITESAETFTARIAELVDDSAVTISQPMTEVTIEDDDAIPVVVQFDPTEYTVTEGGIVEFMLRLSEPSSEEVTVDVSTLEDTADGTDYFGVMNLTVSFPAGSTVASFQVVTATDDIAEGSEIFRAVLFEPVGATIGTDDEAIATIRDPISVEFQPTEYSVTEGGTAMLTAVLSRPSESQVTVQYSTRDGTAVAPGDYSTVTSMVIVFSPGSTSFTFPVPTQDDDIFEDQERFEVFLSNPSGGVVLGSNDIASVDIMDNDPLSISLDPLSQDVAEGDDATINVLLSNEADREITVTFSTQDGTADGSDYASITMVVTFPPGTTTRTVTIPTTVDGVSELQENFSGTLSQPSSGATIATPQANVNILAQPLAVMIFPNEINVNEGEDAVIMLVLSSPSDREVTVDFSTSDGSAIGGDDYDITSTTVTFAPGQTTQTVPVPTNTDAISELQETFSGSLSNPSTGLMIIGQPATVNILAQPLSVMISPNSYDVNEGEDAVITLVLSSASDREVTVDFSTSDGSAIGGDDYDITSTTVTFAPGQTTQTVTVPTNTDAISELQESFGGSLSNPSAGLMIAGGTATVNILPQTVEVGFNPTMYRAAEGDTVDLTVELSMVADRDVTVRYNTEDDTAAAPGDYSPSMGLITFPAGSRTQTITLSTTEDDILEGMENFGAVLSSPSENVIIGQDSAIVEIVDDDSTMINFVPTTYDATEGGTATLVIELSSPSSTPVTVDITTRDGSATDTDYTPQTTTLTFNPGETRTTLDVPISDDDINELPEFFNAVLSNPSDGAALGPDSEATVNIADNDPLVVQFGETMYGVDEGDQATLIIVTNRAADRDVEVDIATLDGTAAAPGDYGRVSATVVIPAGSTTAMVPVSTVDDGLAEPDETFGAQLSNPSAGTTLGPATEATVEISDQNDLTVSVERPDYIVPEPDEEVEVCLVLNIPASEPFSVFASAVNSNPVDAQDGMDFTAEQREFTFEAGSTRACTNFDVIDDEISENLRETFSIQIDMVGPNNLDARIGDTPEASVIIVDDDDLRVSIEQPSYEVPESNGPLEVCLGLNYETDQPFTAIVQIRENDPQDAADIEDFIARSNVSVTFQPGSQRECIEVDIVDNGIVETPSEEVFIIEVAPEEPNPYRATSGPNSEVPVTIVDDDMVRVRILQPEYSVNEGDGTVRVCVIRDGQTTDPITVTLNTRPGTATAGMDYVTTSAPLTILPEETMACVDIPITDDPLAMEGDETFEVFITPPPNVPADETPSTVTITDNDEILLNFEDPAISVNEDIGTRDVCFTPDSPSARDYTVQLARRPTPPNPATAGLDYTVNMDDLTIIISAGEPVMYCVPVGIVDDDIPLEPLEAFTFNFTSLPEGVDRGSVPESRVTIFDNDNTVPLTPNNPTVPEGGGPTPFCVMLPAPPAAQEILAEVVIQASSTTDFAPTSFTLRIPAGELMACMNIIAIDDKVALEEDFVAPATITIVSPRGVSDSTFDATVTLVDNDEVGVSFDTSRYTVSESAGTVTTCLNLNCPTAVPVDVVISTKDGSALGGADYDTDTQTVTFSAGSQNQCADFVITDDSLEELEESFTVCIDSATPPGVNTTSGNSTTTVVIEDDDMVSVRLTQDDYRVGEDMGPVEVCVERVGQTTQDITVTLFTGDLSPAEAEAGQDYINSGVFVVTIEPTETEACAMIPIIDDDLALEGDERFQVTFTPPAGFPSPTPSTITIVDDDVPDVFFTTPEVVVREDTMTGQVCVNSNTVSARPYTVVLSHASSGTNPATAGVDYTVNMADLTVTFRAGAPVEQCVPFMPVDDDLAREGNETFRFTINPSPDINIGSPDMAEVTIIENDFDVVVNFVSEDVRVNEDNGTVTVCVMRDRLTEGPLTVPIAISQGSAGSQDYRETVTDVTFAPGNSMTCAEIPIVDDTEQEMTENFVVGFGMSPDFQPGPRAQSEVTIIDNDEPATASCVLRDSYVVSPFNNSQGYTYRGSCEIVAIQSCNDTERDFSVRVDYITATSDLGAVGVHKDEYIWVSREDGEFVSTARNERVEADGSIFYPFNDVRVTRNTTANTTTISVGDNIGLTIVHNYGDGGSISFSVESGSSLLETCGLCGTQSGQLIDLNGFIATTPAERLRVVETYRTQARYQSLRAIRTECTRLCNDTVIGDPLFTVPYLPPPGEPRRSLCFEVHGRPDTHFNLVSDTCVSVNALYTGVSTVDGPLNIISSIGVRAQDSLGNCQNIRVDLDQCGVSVGMNGALTSLGAADYSQDGISIRRRMTDRVRVSVPNCENVPLSMWVICERGNPVDMIRFQISRGKNLRSTSHGLLAQFWNVMVNVQRFTPPPGSSMEHDADKLYNVTVQAAGDPSDSPMPPYRHFLGDLFPRTWDNTREECLYVGNGQGGPSAEFPVFRDSVIEGRYTDYIVDSIFATDFAYDRIQGNCAA